MKAIKPSPRTSFLAEERSTDRPDVPSLPPLADGADSSDGILPIPVLRWERDRTRKHGSTHTMLEDVFHDLEQSMSNFAVPGIPAAMNHGAGPGEAAAPPAPSRLPELPFQTKDPLAIWSVADLLLIAGPLATWILILQALAAIGAGGWLADRLEIDVRLAVGGLLILACAADACLYGICRGRTLPEWGRPALILAGATLLPGLALFVLQRVSGII